MNLLRRDEAAPAPGDFVLRYAWKSRAVLGTIVVTVGVLGVGAAVLGRLSVLWGALLGFVGATAWLTWARPALRSRGRHGWLLAANPARVVVRFRSFLVGGEAGGKPEALELAADEVEGVRLTSLVLVLDGRGAAAGATRNLYLDLLLRPGVDTSALETRLREEREVRSGGGSRTAHYPVSLPAPGVLRVEVQGPMASAEAPEEAVRRLGAWYAIADAREETVDLSRAGERPGEEVEAGLVALLASGDVMRAALAVRAIRGLSLPVAMEYLDELWARTSAPSPASTGPRQAT